MSDEYEPARDFTVRRTSRWRWVRRTAVSVGVTLLVYFVWVLGTREVTKRESESELSAARAMLDRDDPSWSWERLNAARPVPPAGLNGAELVPQIKRLTHTDWGKASSASPWAPTLDDEPNRQLPSELLTVVRRDLSQSADAVALARTMKDRPWGHRVLVLTPGVLDTLLEDTQNTRHVADLLRWDTAVAAEDGPAGQATNNLLALLNTSRSIGDEPTLISQLVRMAVWTITVRAAERVLGHRTDAVGLAELQAALAADAEEPLLLYGVRGDRALFDRLFENLTNGTTTPDRAIHSDFNDVQARLGWWHYRPNLLGDHAYALTWMTWCVDAARLPVHEQPPVFAVLPAPPNEPNRMLSRAILPAVDKVAQAHWRTTAEVRCAAAGLACERYRQAHGRWPGALAELVPAFLPAVPIDPFSGEPLRLAKPPHGIVVYSVGSPPSDTAGTLDPLPGSVRLGRFRLWDPEHRGRPAPDAKPAPEERTK